MIHDFIRWGFRVLVPIIYLTFILAGLLCAIVSGLIEYEVFAELYQKSFRDSDWVIFSVPFLIVFSFETVKVFLIFLNKQSDISQNSHYSKDKSHFLILRYILIFISFLCTLIYSFYNLQNPEYENALLAETNTIKTKYVNLENQVDNSLNKQLEIQTKQYKNDNIIQQQEIEKQKGIYIRGTSDYVGPKYLEATRLKKQNIDNINIITEKIENNRITQKATLQDNLQNEINRAKKNLSTSSSAGNKMLTATIRILNLNSKVPERQYISLVALISLILSIGLEYIIWSSFTILAMNHGEIFDFSVQTSKYKNATDAEVNINNAEIKKEIKKNTSYANKIINTVSDYARSSLKRIKKDF